MWRPANWDEVVETLNENLDKNRRFDYRDFKILEAGADAMVSAMAAHMCYMMFCDGEEG